MLKYQSFEDDKTKIRSNEKGYQVKGKSKEIREKIVIKCTKDLEKKRLTRGEKKWGAARRVSLERIEMIKKEVKRDNEKENQEIIKTILKKIWRKDKEKRQKKISQNTTIRTRK